jgi:parvulin-like peptidyl-prolyl isomerase
MTLSSRLFSRAILVPVLVAGALVLAACGSSQPSASNTAATVGQTTITTDEVAKAAAVFTAVSGLQQQPCGQVDGATDTQQAACNRYALSALILFRMAESYAADNGITATDADVQKSFDSFEQSVGKDTLATTLQANGVTSDDVKALIKSSLIQADVAKAVTQDRLGPDGLKKKYQDSLANYTTLHVDHILVATQAEAQKIYDQVTAPGFTLADFQALAKQVSTDPNAKKDGGELTLAANQLVPEFANAAIALKPGEISQPVQTQYGWHVIWKIGQEVSPYAKVKSQILQSAQQEEFGAWMHEQTAGPATVTVDPSFGTFDTQQLVVVRISSTDPSATVTPSGAANAATPSP